MSLKVYGLTELSARRKKLGKDVLRFLENVELNYQLTCCRKRITGITIAYRYLYQQC